jgi:predicted DNA-binding transcriptional regulator AlpA
MANRQQVYLYDLIDAVGVAELMGLARRTAVSVYQQRYPDMPRPVIDLGSGRPKLWLRSEMVTWMTGRGHAISTRAESE